MNFSRGMRLLIFTILCTTPLLAWGQTSYIPLIGIPGVDPESGNTDFNEYINSVYALSISIAALLAVLKLVIAGVKWMTSDVVSTKEDAKKDIQGAILGLLIIIGAVIILTVINPNILNVDIDLRTFQTREMPDRVSAEQRRIEQAILNCAESPVCEIISCTADGDEDCDNEIDDCENQNRTVSRDVGDDRITCLAVGQDSTIANDIQNALTAANTFIQNSEDYTGTLTGDGDLFMVNNRDVINNEDLPIGDVARVRELYITQCENAGNTPFSEEVTYETESVWVVGCLNGAS